MKDEHLLRVSHQLNRVSDKTVYLMRGLPSCGKSYTALRLAGATGIVLETDQYFYTEVGDDPRQYDYSADLLPAAQRWNFQRFTLAVGAGVSPIVVDRGNGLNAETRRYAKHGIEHGYGVELREPESSWWIEIRSLLQNPAAHRESLYEWADQLAHMSRTSHRVPAATIRGWMDHWKHDLTVEQILLAPTEHDFASHVYLSQ